MRTELRHSSDLPLTVEREAVLPRFRHYLLNGQYAFQRVTTVVKSPGLKSEAAIINAYHGILEDPMIILVDCGMDMPVFRAVKIDERRVRAHK